MRSGKYKTISGLRRHCGVHHGYGYCSLNDQYVPLMPEQLERVVCNIRANQQHYPSPSRGGRSVHRVEAVAVAIGDTEIRATEIRSSNMEIHQPAMEIRETEIHQPAMEIRETEIHPSDAAGDVEMPIREIHRSSALPPPARLTTPVIRPLSPPPRHQPVAPTLGQHRFRLGDEEPGLRGEEPLDQALLARSFESLTTNISDVDEGASQRTPVALHQAGAMPGRSPAPAVERVGGIPDRLLQPPPLRLADVLDVAANITSGDAAEVVSELLRRHSIPFSEEVLRHVLDAVRAARLHYANTTLTQLNAFTLTGSSAQDILTAMNNYLLQFFRYGNLSN